jgi:hypothetical protein
MYRRKRNGPVIYNEALKAVMNAALNPKVPNLFRDILPIVEGGTQRKEATSLGISENAWSACSYILKNGSSQLVDQYRDNEKMTVYKVKKKVQTEEKKVFISSSSTNEDVKKMVNRLNSEVTRFFVLNFGPRYRTWLEKNRPKLSIEGWTATYACFDAVQTEVERIKVLVDEVSGL